MHNRKRSNKQKRWPDTSVDFNQNHIMCRSFFWSDLFDVRGKTHFLSKTNVRFEKSMFLKKLVFKQRTWENALSLKNQCTFWKKYVLKEASFQATYVGKCSFSRKPMYAGGKTCFYRSLLKKNVRGKTQFLLKTNVHQGKTWYAKGKNMHWKKKISSKSKQRKV